MTHETVTLFKGNVLYLPDPSAFKKGFVTGFVLGAGLLALIAKAVFCGFGVFG